MSHAITAYDGKYYNDEKPLAHIDRSAFSKTIHALYKALEASEFDNGCSGSGEEKCFTKDQIAMAISAIPTDADADQERQFLADCLTAQCNCISITFC